MSDSSAKEPHTIIVTVYKGMVHEIHHIPKGIQVRVQDYDTKNLTEEELKEKTEPDENGDRCFVSIWESQ